MAGSSTSQTSAPALCGDLPRHSTVTRSATPAPDAVRRQTHKDLELIVDAIARRDGKRAEELVCDHLMRTLATINIWQ